MDKRRYWDSNVFLGWFLNESDKADKCHGVIKLAEKGELTIVTSALTLVEVIHLKGKSKLPQKDETKIRHFFEMDFIAVRPLDRLIAERARDLVWSKSVQPKDAVHLATAIDLRIVAFDTFDEQLIGLNKKLGNPSMRIGKPDIAHQEEIAFGKKTNGKKIDKD